MKTESPSIRQKQLPLEPKLVLSQSNDQFTIDDAFEHVIKSSFSAEVIGRTFLEIVDSDDTIDRAIAFAAVVSKARLERQKRQPHR